MKITKLFHSLLFAMAIAFMFPMQSKAQSSDFSEYTQQFFANPKSYSIRDFGLVSLGLDGLTTYEKGESSFTVTSNGFSYRFEDGSEESFNIPATLKDVTVITDQGDAIIPMYVLDDDLAVRVIKFREGSYIFRDLSCNVYIYARNKPSGKYFCSHWFSLRK